VTRPRPRRELRFGGNDLNGFPHPAWLARVNGAALEVDETSVLDPKVDGPRGAPGIPEWGQLAIPKRLLRRGVKDLVRISDGRMSGTSYGICVLPVSPESGIGGPLALVQDGDEIELDRHAAPRSTWTTRSWRARFPPPRPAFGRGYGKPYLDHVLGAHEGADFDFLRSDPGQDQDAYLPTSH
jgi:dihydroxy-acid dehydratase